MMLSLSVISWLWHQYIENKRKKWINWVSLYYFNCASKDTMSRVKENPQYERKYSQIIDLMRFLISRIYGGLLKLNCKKTTWFKKWAKNLKRQFSKNMYEWLIISWKGDHHCSSLGKCKSNHNEMSIHNH